MTVKKTKAELQNEQMLARLESMQEELIAQRALTDQYLAELKADRDDDDDDDFEGDAILLDDPFDSQNAFQVIGDIEPCEEYPDGAKIGWKSPVYRARRQWRGWIPFEYGDQYTGKNGELLTNYIPDPPPALTGKEKIDNQVRRGDVVLARLDMKIFNARQAKRLIESKRRQGLAGSRRKTVLADGVEILGPGLEKSKRPQGGFKPESESVPGGPNQRTWDGPTKQNSEE